MYISFVIKIIFSSLYLRTGNHILNKPYIKYVLLFIGVPALYSSYIVLVYNFISSNIWRFTIHIRTKNKRWKKINNHTRIVLWT